MHRRAVFINLLTKDILMVIEDHHHLLEQLTPFSHTHVTSPAISESATSNVTSLCVEVNQPERRLLSDNGWTLYWVFILT